MENYYENPKYCKKCGKVIPFEKRENSFCNRSCANSYSNSIRVLSEETKKKIANSLKKDKKIKLCKQCGAEKEKGADPQRGRDRGRKYQEGENLPGKGEVPPA